MHWHMHLAQLPNLLLDSCTVRCSLLQLGGPFPLRGCRCHRDRTVPQAKLLLDRDGSHCTLVHFHFNITLRIIFHRCRRRSAAVVRKAVPRLPTCPAAGCTIALHMDLQINDEKYETITAAAAYEMNQHDTKYTWGAKAEQYCQ